MLQYRTIHWITYLPITKSCVQAWGFLTRGFLVGCGLAVGVELIRSTGTLSRKGINNVSLSQSLLREFAGPEYGEIYFCFYFWPFPMTHVCWPICFWVMVGDVFLLSPFLTNHGFLTRTESSGENFLDFIRLRLSKLCLAWFWRFSTRFSTPAGVSETWRGCHTHNIQKRSHRSTT